MAVEELARIWGCENVDTSLHELAAMMNISPSYLLSFAALRAAVGVTIDSGVHYQDEFEAACLAAWGETLPVTDNQLPELLLISGEACVEKRAKQKAAIEQVATGPRGTWMVSITTCPETGKVWYVAMISHGNGEVSTRNDGWSAKPTFDKVAGRMVAYEIYLVRKHVEIERAQEAAVHRVEDLGLRKGMKLRNVQVSCNTYSSAMIEEIGAETGELTLLCTKRGSRNRFRVVTSAMNLRLDVGDLVSSKKQPALTLSLAAA